VGPDAATALSGAMAMNTSLQYVDLGMCKINDEGAKALATGLMSNSTLMGLNLEMNAIGNDGIASLEESLSHNGSIKVLNVVGNPADESLRRVLQAKATNGSREVTVNAAAIETAKSNFFATQPQPPQQNAPHPAPASSQHECQQNSISASQPSPASPPPQRQPSDSGPGSPDMLPRPLSRLGSNLKQITGAQLDACKGERIGGGGFGSVYMGTLNSAPVAIKIIEAEDMGSFESYEKEVTVLATARHPFIVQLFATCDERQALIMEHMEGGNLQEKIDNDGMPWFTRVRVLHESCVGLQFLHNQEPAILHRDIKPSNILLSSDMRAKLGDVGLAKIADNSARLSRTMSTAISGSLYFLDPQYQRSGNYSAESDIYSLGLTIAVAVTNEAPAGMDGLLRDAIEDETLGDLVDQRPGTCGWDMQIATQLLELASKCLKANVSKRPSLSEVTAQLEEMAAEASSAMAINSAQGGFTQEMKDSMRALLSCPITFQVMTDPVVAEDGFTYERAAIEMRMKTSSKSPLTNVPMGAGLIPNRNMKIMLAQFKAIFGI